LSNPEFYTRAQAEVDDVYPVGESPLNTLKHESLHFLAACINETLRLHPPVPTNGSRRVPDGSGGRLIAGRLIPEGTEVHVPPYSLHRDPRYFAPFTNDFWPDRWMDMSGSQHPTSHNTTAFVPFSYGPSNCVGRNLAKQEMLMVASLLLQKFDMRFADGYSSEKWTEELHDWFVMTRGTLSVVLTPRF